MRELVDTSLAGMGYRVKVARDGPEALKAIAGMETIDLLLSDVILPGGMLGPDIARELARTHPDARVLLMLGYTRDALGADGASDEQFELLQKPFTRKQLAARLSQLLDTPPPPPGMA